MAPHKMVRQLARLKAPWRLILCILMLTWSDNLHHGPVDFVDFFCGEGAQSAAFRAAGWSGHDHDIRKGAALVLGS